jgi:cytochrome P450
MFANPYPIYERLRREHPVYWSSPYRHWLVTRYADVKAVLLDPQTFSSFGWEPAYFRGLSRELQERTPVLQAHYAVEGLINSDPPRHTGLRKIVNRMFTPTTVGQLRGRIGELVDAMLDEVASAGSMDVVADLAYPLPAIVISELLGVPAQDRDRFKLWTADLISFFGLQSPTLDIADRAERSIKEHREYMLDLINARRAKDHGDILSVIVSGGRDGTTIADDELLSICIHLLAAGHETTTNLITSALLALMNYPQERELVRQDRGSLAAVVEEALRWEAPVQRVKRVATHDVDLCGSEVRKGDTVMAIIGAANRDPERFPRPDLFDSQRPDVTGHFGFGHGVHFCIGAALARLEAPIALERLLSRFGDLAPRSGWEPAWTQHLTLRGLRELPIVFERTSANTGRAASVANG